MSIGSDLREGRQLGVPLCCRLRFALEYALNPDRDQAVKRGVNPARNGVYTPCGIFHKAAMTHPEFEAWLNDPARPW